VTPGRDVWTAKRKIPQSSRRLKEAEKSRFFALADRLSISTDEKERESIKKELAKLTFGE
jgi:hypothetical protein